MKISFGKFLAIAVILLPISYTIDSFLSYYDEIFVLGFIIYTVLFRRKTFLKCHKWTFMLILLFYLLGFISNYYSELVNSVFPILIDSFTIFKQFIIYLILSSITNKRDKVKFIKTLIDLSRIYIVLAFIFSILSQFVDLGMSIGGVRYGIIPFAFLSGNNSGFGITIIFCLLILASSKISKQRMLIYLALASVSLILTTKGVIYSFLTFSLVIYWFSKKGRLRKRDFAFLIGSLLLISSFQLKEYLLNDESPRMVLILSSYSIATDYYPLGSGFATFGSEQARKNYSPLYMKYGFNNIYGLSKKDDMFLNDNYIAMITAETGFFGLLLYFLILFMIFKKINTDEGISFRLKIFLLAVLLMLYTSSIATGIIKTANGVFIFAVLGILQSNKNLIVQKNEE